MVKKVILFLGGVVVLSMLVVFLFVILQKKEEVLKVKLLFGGDLMLDRGVKRSVYKNFDGDYTGLFEGITNYLHSFDGVIVNLEGPISHRGKQIPKPYSFRFETNIIKTLKEINIVAVNLANNHIYDWGETAFIDTINYLISNEIGIFGVADISNGSWSYIFVKSNQMLDVKIGFLGFSEFFKGQEPNSKKPIGLCIIDETSIEKAILSLRSNVDFLIVSFHWGEEYKKKNNAFQERIAKLCIDLGADMVVGHHPHVIQNYEIYKDRYIFYSLGNFVFDQRFSKDTLTSGIVELEITKTKTNVYASKVILTNLHQDKTTLKLSF